MSRRNQVRGLVASTMAVLAVTLPACGGGGKSPSTTTSAAGVTIPAAFIAKVDAVCANGVQRLNAHGKFPYQQFDPLHPNTALLPKVGAFFRPNIAIDQSVVTQLKALG